MSIIKTDKAVIITIGNEILSGKTVDTNSSYIAEKLGGIGICIVRTIVVGDTAPDIQWAAKEACSAAPLIISTGGLGPTRDDISKRAIANHFGRQIKIDREQLRIVKEKFRVFGYDKMPETNISQAEVPDGAVIFPNPRGTAPGLLIIDGDIHFFMLPGVPMEMKGLMNDYVVPYLRKNLQKHEHVLSRTIRTTGIGESRLAEILNPVISGSEIAYLPDPLGVDLRLTAKGADREKLRKKIKNIEDAVLKVVSEFVYGYDDDTLESVVGSLLKKHKLTLAIAESCTGGLIGDRITAVSGSSLYFDRGVIAYSNQSKIDLLGVNPATLKEKGAVSKETAQQMAEGIRKRSGCDIGVSTTGIAGPTGGTSEKPVGTVFTGLSDKFGVTVEKLRLKGGRTRIKRLTAQTVLNFIRLRLNDKNLYSD